MKRISLNGKAIENTQYSSEKILLDTNLLVFAHHKGSPYHSKASYILLAALQDDLRAHISNQNLFEFFSVMTAPGRINPTPDVNDISRICSDLLASHNLRKIYTYESAIKETFEMVKQRKLRGPKIFDCLLAITARQNKIDRIWTDNIADMKHFEDFISIENPLLMKWKLQEEEDSA
jgi:predicted nucleic acid-binding protein